MHKTRNTHPLKLTVCVLAVTVCSLLCMKSSAQAQEEHPLAPAIRMAKISLKATEDIEDYQGYFSSRELVGRTLMVHNGFFKVRHEPFSVYIGFLRPNEGREVIYVAGQNQGKLLAHDSGLASLVGTVALDPLSTQAMKESRHPVTQIGLKNLVAGIIMQWEKESKYGECNVKYYPNAMLGQVECKVIECSHPVPRREFPFSLTRLYIDSKTNLPVRLEQYGWPSQEGQQAPLLEEYTYTNIKVNVGLKDIDFDVRNPNYKF